MNYIHKYYQLEELRCINLSNNNNEITPFQLKIQLDQKRIRSQLPLKVSREMIIYFNFHIDQGLSLIKEDQLSDISQLDLVDLEDYRYYTEQLQSLSFEEVLQISVCDKIMDEIECLQDENFNFIKEHFKLFRTDSFPYKSYQRILQLEENEYDLEFDEYTERYYEKKEILQKLQKTSIFQLKENLIPLEEKNPHLAQLDELINYNHQIDASSQLEENTDALKKQENQLILKAQEDISFISIAQLLQEPLDIESPQQLINIQTIGGSTITTCDQISTDEEEEDLEELTFDFDKKYKVQLIEDNNISPILTQNNLNPLKDPDKMSSNQSIILNKKFKIQSDPSEIHLGSSQIFDLAMQNYQILAGKYDEILNNVYLTTTTPSQRESLAKAYKATRLQINQENQASTAYRQRKGEFSETIGEMTKIAIQAIQVLNSEELCKVWQFEKVESGSLASALQSFIDNYIHNNEQKLSDNSLQNAIIDQDQLEQIVSLSQGLAIFGRQKDFKTDEIITDPFFNQIPYVFTNHFNLINRVLDPKWNKNCRTISKHPITDYSYPTYYELQWQESDVHQFSTKNYSSISNQLQELNNSKTKHKRSLPKQQTKPFADNKKENKEEQKFKNYNLETMKTK